MGTGINLLVFGWANEINSTELLVSDIMDGDIISIIYYYWKRE
jgi:hypothetical protein